MSEITAAKSYLDITSLKQLGYEAHNHEEKATKEAAKQFESYFLQMMLKSMRQANEVFEKDNVISNESTKMYRDMFDKQVTLEMSHGQGVGLSDVIERQLSKTDVKFHMRDDGLTKHHVNEKKLLPFTMAKAIEATKKNMAPNITSSKKTIME